MTTTSALFLFLLFAILHTQLKPYNLCNGASTSTSCIAAERDALLDFKQGLVNAEYRLSSWEAATNEDCCKWEGITCNNLTGHILKLDLRNPHPQNNYLINRSTSVAPHDKWTLKGELKLYSLVTMEYLQYLDLSCNDFGFRTTNLGFLGSLHHLQYLNLSLAGIHWRLTHQLANLTKLQFLDLQSAYPSSDLDVTVEYWYGNYNDFIVDDNMDWISHLSSLKYINMNGISLSGQLLGILNTIPSIAEIHLQSCDLKFLPLSLPYVNFTSLSVLDLSRNFDINSTIPSWLFNISSLEYLDISENSLQGYIPSAIENWTILKSLDFSGTFLEFQGVATLNSLGKLCHLESLRLKDLNISMDLSELHYIFSPCIKTNLEILDLGSTNIRGQLPKWLWNLTRLKYLDLSYNELNGTIPTSLGWLAELNYLDLSYNALSGVITEAHFDKLTKLKHLALGDNLLSIQVRSNWSAQFQLEYIFLDSCYLGPQFPTWLRDQESASYISISNAGIVGPLPDWFPRFISHAKYLIMSNNQISGGLPDLTQSTNLLFLDLSSNCLIGPLPHFPSSIQSIYLSNNSFSTFQNNMSTPFLHRLSLSSNIFTGRIPLFFCQLQQLSMIDLSKNQLVGQLPDCWNDSSSIQVLDFSNNKYIHGEIHESIGNLYSLRRLSLNGNSLSGKLPLSLSNCKELAVLDVGNNNLSGEVPTWIGENLQNLLVLKLGSNAFHGVIPPNLSNATQLQILDLSNNNLSGTIPRNFGNITGMKSTSSIIRDLTYKEDIEVTLKGEIMVYSYNFFPLVVIMDLSNNCLSGSIPKELTSLIGLVSLNLSRNHLVGEIPTSISNMKHLESLDLCVNHLSGSIPLSMNDLTSLCFLNLSHNNLSGAIPQGNQMLTFSVWTFEGNPGLCGPPLVTPCHTSEGGQTAAEEANSSEIIWLYTGIAPGFAVGFWSIWGALLLKKKWRDSYFRMLDKTYDGIYVFLAVKFSLFQRRI